MPPRVTLAPVTLVRGPESLLRERAIASVVALAKEADPTTELNYIPAADYAAGTLAVVTSPSLFGEPKVVIIEAAEAGNAALDADIIKYLPQPDPDVTLIIEHGGGVRGKKMLDAVTATKAPVLQCNEVKKEGDKIAFVNAELRAARRRAEPAAVQALVAALGSDLRELAAAVAQLNHDTEGTISAQTVDQYYGGRQEATGFAVADAAIAGDVAAAIPLLRHALATGAAPVAILGAFAMKLRNLAKVAAIRSGTNLTGVPATAKGLGLQDWQVRAAQKDLRGWSDDQLGNAISAVAAADAAIKGGELDGGFAVERAVLAVAQRR